LLPLEQKSKGAATRGRRTDQASRSQAEADPEADGGEAGRERERREGRAAEPVSRLIGVGWGAKPRLTLSGGRVGYNQQAGAKRRPTSSMSPPVGCNIAVNAAVTERKRKETMR